ncbi:MAG: hypothetical protein OEW59_09760, partial [Gammaproteobacteria bacterium]|nr:hypothetical protein [Gammaproteobacteria bacterium]
VGGWGHDWISGGTGQDGALGDDGRIFTSRNGMTEPLIGLTTPTVQTAISTPGNMQQATINVTNALKKAVDLTPYNPVAGGHELSDPAQADDIIYGGLGDDFLHGGAGDDAISGAEALPVYYDRPFNLGDVLRYSEVTGEFAEYDEFEPRLRIVYDANTPPPAGYDAGAPFVLNFDHTEGANQASATYGIVQSDGNDAIFGDLGNDWLVGGTGRDNLYGGWGDDLLNADDDHSTNGGLNDAPDTHPSYEDRAYGGAGRDRLIANTGGDRLIDWAGEFNSYIVPFAPFGLATVSRSLQPQLAEFLYALSASDGADFTRGGDAARNGEPDGELGMVRQQDFAWQDQTGAPDDPQPGNIPGGPRDVLRSASFDDPALTGFFTDSGSFTASGGTLKVAAESLGGDAVSVYAVGEQLPSYFEVQASVKMDKPTGGWKGNAYVIFDYQNEQDFKFVGIDESINKLVIGHRDASGWHVDKQGVVQGGVKADKWYNMLVAINGTTVTLVVDNKQVFQQTYAPRVVDGYAYGLNYGYVGVGSDNSRGSFDNIRVQILPPQVTFDDTDDFSGADTGEFFTGGSSGVWGFNGGRYTVDPGASLGTSMLDLGPDNLNFNSYLELNAKVKTSDQAGFIFDRYGDDSFKFVVIDENSQKLIIGHYTKKAGWVEDASVSTTISATKDYTLGLTLKGSTVSATLSANGGGFQAMLGHVFNSATVDGTFGLLAKDGSASFDDVRVKTNDDAFVPASGGSMNAADTVTLAGAEPSD